MDDTILNWLAQMGISGTTGLTLFFVIREMLGKRDKATGERKEHRDMQIASMEQRIEKIEQDFLEQRNDIGKKIDKLYDRLNPLGDAVNRLLGYMEAKNDKG